MRVVITHIEQVLGMVNEIQMEAEGDLEALRSTIPLRLHERTRRAALQCFIDECAALSNEIGGRFQASVEFGEAIGEDPLPTTVIISAQEVARLDRILAVASTWTLDYGYELKEKE